MIIYSKNIIAEDGVIDGYLVFENGVITDIVRKDVEELKADVDWSDKTIIPGIVDTHNHGMMGYEPGRVTEDDNSNLLGYLKAVASVGVTGVFPTVTDENSCYPVIVKTARGEYDGAQILGIHSEGPYLNRVGEKGVDKGHPDIDLAFLEKMVKEADGMLKLVAIAPELEGSKEAIRYLTKNGVRVAYAHSNDNYQEAMEAFKNGITVATHTANVMSGIHHRNMGGLGACLLNDEINNELICDGLHVCNEMMEMMFRIKNDSLHKFLMISDNVCMAGLPAGKYAYHGYEMFVTEVGFCLTETGRLMGSAMPVLWGIKNLVENIGYPLEEVVIMSSLNPCQVYGWADKKGSLKVGKDADFAVIDSDFKCLYTYREGKKVYDYQVDTDIKNMEFFKAHYVQQ